MILIIIFPITVFAQNTTIKGEVIDSETNEPVSYAAVCIYNELKGISTNAEGKFELELRPEDFNKQIVISVIAYHDTILSVSMFEENTAKKILLKPKTYAIAEATVIAYKRKVIIVDKLHKSFFNQLALSGPSDPLIIAKLFNYTEKYNGFYLNEISIFFDCEFDYQIKPTFVLRIFAKDTVNNRPGEDLIEKAVVKLDSCKPQMHYKFTYQLKKPIRFPETGIFIGIEWIAIKENLYSRHYQVYAPALAGKYRDKIENNLWEFYGGKWKLKTDNQKNSEPYIQLNLVD